MSQGCIEFQGHKRPDGYGRTTRPGSRRVGMAHRMVWEDRFGPIPKGLFVCHTCDNPSCVNHEHLFLGTAAENNSDKTKKGRSWKCPGPMNPSAKLNEWQVCGIMA